MPHVSLRVSEEEKKWMESYAELNSMSLSDAIKAAFFEKLENEYDLSIIKEYEASTDNATYTHEEVGKMLGFK